MTRREAIENHRKMWNWIADETLRRKEVVSKKEYLSKNLSLGLHLDCFCCEYNGRNGNGNCNKCPLVWPLVERISNIPCINSVYGKWKDESDWEKAAEYAREIANLPEAAISCTNVEVGMKIYDGAKYLGKIVESPYVKGEFMVEYPVSGMKTNLGFIMATMDDIRIYDM